jgi:hypothetical protein
LTEKLYDEREFFNRLSRPDPSGIAPFGALREKALH